MIKPNLARRILVVDADPSVRELLRSILVSDGHHVDEAQSRSQAYDKLNRSDFDVVLTGPAELEVTHHTPFPQVEVHGDPTPVLTISADPFSDPTDELQRFTFNPFDLISIRQALEAIQQMVSLCTDAISVPQTEKLSAA